MKGKNCSRSDFVDICVPRTVLSHPEELPLALRNFVVELSRQLPTDDRKAFAAYMKVVSELERAFRDELMD